MKKVFAFIVASIFSTTSFGGEVADLASGIGGSLSASFRTCVSSGEDCQKNLDSTLKDLRNAGFTILKVESCHPQDTSGYYFACPDKSKAEKIGNIYFVK